MIKIDHYTSALDASGALTPLKWCIKCQRWVSVQHFKLKYYSCVRTKNLNVYLSSYCCDCYKIHYPSFRRSPKHPVLMPTLPSYNLSAEEVDAGVKALEGAIDTGTIATFGSGRDSVLKVWSNSKKNSK